MYIIDRRLNPGGKSLANRQRFLRRAKEQVQRAVRDSAGARDIKGLEQGGEVTIPADGVREPSLRRAPVGGRRDHIVPGNKTYVEGDTIERPDDEGGGGSGAGEGSGEDAFRFALTRDEFLDLFLDDLELPDLVKRRLTLIETEGLRRAGFTVSGSPANLALTRTLRNSLSRRLALRRPKTEEIGALEREIGELAAAHAPAERLAALEEELAALKQRSRRVPYIDPLDIRYRRFEPTPKPVSRAVMFCLMDVSGSMTEHMKRLAKRFFMLLHLFLSRRYQHVDLVFIRHTDRAAEVDEDTFFNSRETGGTLVSSALAEMKRVVAERYSPADWNIYAAQASDGDNTTSDDSRTSTLMRESILPACQYFAYLEVGDENGRAGFVTQRTSLWRTYEGLCLGGEAIAMRKVNQGREIYPVFRELFQRREARAKAAQP